MKGAIIGDIIGSSYEIFQTKNKKFKIKKKFSWFTDDTVLTVATMDYLLHGGDLSEMYRKYCRSNFGRGFGGKFFFWSWFNMKKPYNSMGNGSAMRVSPVAYTGRNLEEVLRLAKETAEVTHNHPEGIKGAQAIAGAIYLARTGNSMEDIGKYINSNFYNLESLEFYRKEGKPGYTCPNSVPQAIVAFLESTDYKDCIRNAVSLAGDSDTVACMAGGIAEAYYKGVPEDLLGLYNIKITDKFNKIIEEFYRKYYSVEDTVW